MTSLYIVHYAEIGLKGKNRPDFEKQLIRNIGLKHHITRARRLHGRIIVESDEVLDLRDVFGVAWWSPAVETARDIESITAAAVELAQERAAEAGNFAIRAAIAYKPFPYNSQELEAQVGGHVQDAIRLPVNLSAPQLTVYIEVTKSAAYLHTERHAGPGGLPVGTAGKLVGLLSGGIDSAVATYMMAKRGAQAELVHFYASPSAENAHDGKVGQLAQSLARFVPHIMVHYLPYHSFQLATADLPSGLRRQELVAFRRFIARAAERIAQARGGGAIFTGDNLGQVASQTLENLAAVDECITLPIFRPLIAFDKLEIIDLAKKVGLYELGILPYRDCCSLLARHPATRAKSEQLLVIEERAGIGDLLERTLGEMTTYRYGPGEGGERISVSAPQDMPSSEDG